jgi:UDPglucose 6-dehydrogenase
VAQRPYEGKMMHLRTKMGRRLTVTADHPMIVRSGDDEVAVKLAAELTTEDWLPVSLGAPLPDGLGPEQASMVEAVTPADRIPDVIWTASESAKQALLRGLWAGDGSWSLLNGGPSVALEYGTVSAELADGMLRLLGELGIVARQKIARTTRSTVDTHWLVISGADQIEECLWLLEPHERDTVQTQLDSQSKRIAPTGYRVDRKGTAWVRVTEVTSRLVEQTVYSVEVDRNHTVVTTAGLVAHNCFPKDSRALLKIAHDAGYHFDLLDGVIAVNDEQFDRMADKIRVAAGGDLSTATIAVWGLTFKARTDDLRDSPAIAIINRLLAAGATVQAYDPTVAGPKPGVPDGITIAATPYAACAGANTLAVLTEWDEFRWLDIAEVAAAMPGRSIVDTRNLLERNDWKRAGFDHQGVGR